MSRLIAIDLGSHSVKVSTYRGVGRKYVFEERQHQVVPQDGRPPNLDARLAALDALLDEHSNLTLVGGDVCAAVLPGEYASFHHLTLPFTDRAQVDKTLSFAVEADVPFDLDDMVLGSRILEVSNQTEVLTVLVRHDRLAHWIGELAERNVDPSAVYVDGEVLGHYAGSGGPAVGDTLASAVIDIGHAHTVVSIVVNGVVQTCRTINVGGLSFTRAIQQAMGCEWAEAEARKHGTHDDAGAEGADDEVTDPGRPRTGSSGYSRLPRPARMAMDGAIGLLLAEIRSTLIKTEDTLKCEIGQVLLTGGSSKIPEIWDYLASDLGIPVARGQDPDGVAVPAAFALTHAVAMEVAGQSTVEAIDLRIGDLAYRGGTDVFRAVLTYGAAGLAFFSMAAIIMFAVQFRSLMVEQSAADARLREIVTATLPEIPADLITDGSTAVAVLAEATEEAVQRASRLGDNNGGVPPIINQLALLTEAFPPHEQVKVEVSTLRITPTNISFDAETDGYASSASVEESLQASETFRLATKGDETKRGAMVKFPVSIPLGEDATEEEG